MKRISIVAILVSVLTVGVAAFLFCSALLFAPRISSARLMNVPQERLERLVRAGDIEALRTDFDRVVRAVNAGLVATDNLMTNLMTLSILTLVSFSLNGLAWFGERRARGRKPPAD